MSRSLSKIVLLTSVALVLAACGSDSEEAPPQPEASAPPVSTPKPQRTATIDMDRITHPDAVLLTEYIDIVTEVSAETELNGFVENGFHHTLSPPRNYSGRILGSHGPRGDAETGYAEITFAAPDENEVVYLPVTSGPVPEDMHLTFVSEDGEQLGNEIDVKGIPKWGLLRLDLPDCETCSTYTLKIEDKGAGWGQWIAVGLPQVSASELSDRTDRSE